jgi:hypothetical protein
LNLCDGLPHQSWPATEEFIMPAALKSPAIVSDASSHATPWMHLVWLSAAGFFVSLLALTYGLDLSPGLF